MSYLENIDGILKKVSDYLFFDLEDIDLNILKRLADDGPQNLTELGGQSRRNRKKRLNGSPGTLGLITNGFVHQYPVNKKENNYDLTFKGLLAVLSTTKFENIYLVETYKKFLWKKIKKKKLLRWSLSFIKYEIALILYHNYMQGLNWTRFKYVTSYWSEFKTYNPHTMKTFFMHGFYDKNTNNEYDTIEKGYLTLLSILDYCTYFTEWELNSSFYDVPSFPLDKSFRVYVDRWFSFIDQRNLDVHSSPELEYEWYDRHENNISDGHNFFYLKLEEHRKKAKEILQRNGYETTIMPPPIDLL